MQQGRLDYDTQGEPVQLNSPADIARDLLPQQEVLVLVHFTNGTYTAIAVVGSPETGKNGENSLFRVRLKESQR
jgi:hypothetical protein